MSGTAIMLLCMTPAAVLVLLVVMSMLENLLLDRHPHLDDTPADPLPSEIVAVEQS